jgi:hypothetical protein
MVLSSFVVAAMYPSIGQKVFMGYLSVIIALGGYLLYIASMYKGASSAGEEIRPHPLSWALFGLLTAIGGLIQTAGGGEAGSWCLVVTAAFCFIIAGLSYAKYEWQFSRGDYLWIVVGIFLFLFYLFTKNPTLSVTLAIFADLAGYGPTIKKGWHQPSTDNPVNFVFNSAKCVPALFALSSYSWDTSGYLWMLLVVNGLVAIMLIARKAYLSRP